MASSPSPSSSAKQTYNYPFATSPDIIRAHEKDAFFATHLLSHLSTLLRTLYGARFLHAHTAELRAASDALYLALTTGLGNRTLGEEYCDVVQVEVVGRRGPKGQGRARLPAWEKRAAYVVGCVLVPYLLNRVLPLLRRRVRATLETRLARSQSSNSYGSGGSGSEKHARRRRGPTTSTRLQAYVLANLDTLTSPGPVYAISLATFYFSGAYYHLSKRACGLRYIFTREQPPETRRAGYEVLGVLLVLQLAVQGYLHLRSTVAASSSSTSSATVDASMDANAETPMLADANAAGSTSAVIDAGVEVSLNPPNTVGGTNTLLFEIPGGSGAGDGETQHRLARLTHTPVPGPTPRVELADKETMGWLRGRQARKCTLCLEAMREPSVTTCGHVFCWGCIGDWCREKPECPLCRQACLVQHVLPLRG